MRKGQLVKIKDDVPSEPDVEWSHSDAFIIVKGPYEGIFKEGKNSRRLAKVVDLLSPTGHIWSKVECIYLERA